ncbi:MAG: hypothetical protein JST33_03665 [Actinobacteria bacterium]|nr:hypothetical protein [Actinomycetota bacterium]
MVIQDVKKTVLTVAIAGLRSTARESAVGASGYASTNAGSATSSPNAAITMITTASAIAAGRATRRPRGSHAATMAVSPSRFSTVVQPKPLYAAITENATVPVAPASIRVVQSAGVSQYAAAAAQVRNIMAARRACPRPALQSAIPSATGRLTAMPTVHARCCVSEAGMNSGWGWRDPSTMAVTTDMPMTAAATHQPAEAVRRDAPAASIAMRSSWPGTAFRAIMTGP